MPMSDHADNGRKNTYINSYSDVLQQCLKHIENGNASIEECVARYPQFDELEGMLRAVSVTRALPRPVLPLADKAEIRQLALARLKANPRKQSGHKQVRWRGKSVWLRLALVVGAIVILISLSGVTLVQAASVALPNDPLYVFKRVDEQIELSFASGDARINILARIAQMRLDEIDSLVARNRTVSNAMIVDASSSVMAAILSTTNTDQRNQLHSRAVRVFTEVQATGTLSLDTFNNVMVMVSPGSSTPTDVPNAAAPVANPVPTAAQVVVATATPTASDTAIGTDASTPDGTETPGDDSADGNGKGKGPVSPAHKPTQNSNASGNGNGNGNGNGKGGGR